MKDQYKEQRCFVIGNGPSLSPEILDRLIDEYTFAVNRIAVIFNKTEWRPTFYIGTTDAIFDKRHRGDILAGIRSSKTAVCWDKYREIRSTRSMKHIIFVRCSNIGDLKSDQASNGCWSDDLSSRLDKFGVAVFPALQVAVYLGFATIYLIGCDGNYTSPIGGVDKSHFDSAYRPFDVAPGYDYEQLNEALLRAHKIAETAAKRRGVKIYNCSPISAITAHEKIDLEKVL
jgi:hypothetical protein